MGSGASDHAAKDCTFPCDCGRYVEIWNLVFMQFNRDASGAVTPLPKPSIDTGAGLDRLTSVLQGKVSIFDTDLFTPLIERAADLTGTRFGTSAQSDASLRIIADHSRATTFLIADGVIPSNEGRGYVLRKIMRRALRHGRLLNSKGPFLTEMVIAVRKLMGDAYPDLFGPGAAQVLKVVYEEEKRFGTTLEIGLAKLEDDLRPLTAFVDSAFNDKAMYAGEKAFKLYDTYGLPLDFITDAARDLRIPFDEPGFHRAMAEQRERARASWKGGHKDVANPVYGKLAQTFRTGPDF
jgi:alanyl-tRNA synthetase